MLIFYRKFRFDLCTKQDFNSISLHLKKNYDHSFTVIDCFRMKFCVYFSLKMGDNALVFICGFSKNPCFEPFVFYVILGTINKIFVVRLTLILTNPKVLKKWLVHFHLQQFYGQIIKENRAGQLIQTIEAFYAASLSF